MLGSTVVEGADGPVPLPARKPRSILAALALAPGTTMSADRLVDLVWGDDAPAGAHGTLHAYISGLRRALEPDLAPRARPTVLVTTDAGYRLEVAPDDVDAVAFAREVRARHSALAPLWSQLSTGPQPGWPSREEVAAHVEALEEALRTWTGPAYVDLGDHPDVLADRAALDELRAAAEEDLALGLLALGEHAAVLAATEQAATRHPLRERSRCLRALGLVRTGRQVEALEVLRTHRALLADELGLDPGPEARALEEAVLRQEPGLGEWLRERPVPPGAPPPVGGSVGVAPASGWMTVGRDAEREVVAGLLSTSASGRPGAVLVVGDPGTGKTRLVEDALAAAAGLGTLTAVGRCSRDDGAPPLWPWFAILDDLGLEGPREAPSAGARAEAVAERAFAVQDALVRGVRARAAEQPVLLVVEDLHWADTRTLRALTHLVENLAPGDRVLLVVTRRARPAPTGALADLGVALTRYGAPTLELGGLRPDDARVLVDAVSPGPTGPDAALVERWCRRTGGNPFFLVELARLAAGPGGWRGEVPESVQAVVGQRLGDLPEATREVLLVAAALGREHSPLLLARVGGWDAEEVAERLEAAEEVGVVHHRSDGRLAFEHALTRDAVLAAATPAAVSRTHARIAHALEQVPRGALTETERSFDLAHHWLAAGPLHAPRAWRSAHAAAAEARQVFANVEATELYRSALDAHALDPAGTRDERYDLLLAFAGAAAFSGRWRWGVAAVVEAVSLARTEADPERVARAAAELTRHSVWTPQEFGEVDEDLVEDLRTTLRDLGPHDPPVRCVLMLALAVQLYYAYGTEPEVDALVAEGTAIARRTGDPALRAWAAHAGWIALWRPTALAERTALADEQLAAAIAQGDDAAVALAHIIRAGTAVERGDLEGWLTHSAAAEALARRRRFAYIEYVLAFVRLALGLLADDHDAADGHAATMRSMREGLATPALELNEFGILYSTATWRPGFAASVAQQMLDFYRAEPFEMGRYAMLHVLAVAGRDDDLREQLARTPFTPLRDRWWHTAEAAAHVLVAARVGDRALARGAVEALRPSTGTMAVTGISLVNGPVDGYLAIGLAVLGEHDEARVLAGRAEALARRWGMTAYLRLLEEHRRALGF